MGDTSDNGNQPAAPAAPADGGTPAAGDAAPAWFQSFLKDDQDYKQKVDGRIADMGRQVAKYNDRSKPAPSTPPTGDGATPPQGPNRDDLGAVYEIAQTAASLSEEARAEIDALVQDGNYTEAARTARLLAKYAGQTGKSETPPPPPGNGATPAPSSPGKLPVNMMELMKLKAEEPKRYAEIMSPHHEFDPSRLR